VRLFFQIEDQMRETGHRAAPETSDTQHIGITERAGAGPIPYRIEAGSDCLKKTPRDIRTGFLSYGDALAAQRAADALLLLIPDADGRGDTVLSGKVFEYIASARPILAAVPPAGMAADLVRRSGAGEVADGEDAVAVSAALERLADRWLNGGLPDVQLAEPLRDELSRRSRARDLAEVLRSAAG
jgi:glycosyltransferase involved in cell wall biosynthesis